MNKFTKALLLSLLFAAPVAICVPAVQANTVEKQSQQVAGDTTKKLFALEASRDDVSTQQDVAFRAGKTRR